MSTQFLGIIHGKQTKFWKVLSKYDRLPDHFHDLQTTLQTKFSLLKKATSKNIKNLQEAINLQQACTTSLCGHINSIYAKLAQLDTQVRTYCLCSHPQLDVVQINAPEYDCDIDGQTDLLPDMQPLMASHTACPAEVSSNAENIIEDTASVIANSKEHPASLQDSDRLEPQSQPVLDHSVYQDIEQPRQEYPTNYRSQLEDIPELEDKEENWEEGQFVDVDFIDHHSTTEESDQIRHQYSAHFEKVTDQGYSSQNNRTPGFEHYIPEPECYCHGLKIRVFYYFFYISETLQMTQISFMASLLNAVL